MHGKYRVREKQEYFQSKYLYREKIETTRTEPNQSNNDATMVNTVMVLPTAAVTTKVGKAAADGLSSSCCCAADNSSAVCGAVSIRDCGGGGGVDGAFVDFIDFDVDGAFVDFEDFDATEDGAGDAVGADDFLGDFGVSTLDSSG
mmetsp:Transcript_32699/g.37454  ORF Transcript_32699/g.37454 Transcript_32699/m.37454 type:complete len:145 (+) Transcript_32699:311-745(+)